MLTTQDIERIGKTVSDVTRPQFDMVHQEIAYMHERFTYMHEQFGFMHEKFHALDRYRERVDAEMVTKSYLEERLKRFRDEPGS
jgi:hypothetical protein